MNKNYILMACLCLVTLGALADGKKQKNKIYIKGFSWSAFSEMGELGRYINYNRNYDNTFDRKNLPKKPVTHPFPFSLITLGFNNHFIVKKMGKEKSITINFHPALGFGYTQNKALNVSFPLMVCYNSGIVSTYESRRSKGYTVGIGAEYIKAGIINKGPDGGDHPYGSYGYRYYGFNEKLRYIFQPCINFGMRFSSPSERAEEFNVKFGGRMEGTYDKYGQMLASENISTFNFWLRVSLTHYIRY